MDEFAKQNEVRKLSGCCGVNDADIWDEGYQSYHGRPHERADAYISEAWSKACREESAEAIVDTDTSLPKGEKKKAGGLTKY